jgi:hypothetical protein
MLASMRGEAVMSKSVELTMSPSEREELEALLDAYLAEVKKDKGEHERAMARIDQNLKEARRLLAVARENLDKPCGRSY